MKGVKDMEGIYKGKDTKLYEFYFYIDGLIDNPHFHNLSKEDLDAIKYLKKFFELMNEDFESNSYMCIIEGVTNYLIEQAKKGVF